MNSSPFEGCQVRIERRGYRRSLSDINRPPSLPIDLWVQIHAALRPNIGAIAAGLESRVAHLEGRVVELTARLYQNSSNSSKPPSSDGPHIEPTPPKTPSGKRRGGQPGHPRNERPA